jgi:hypothetical protein
LADYITGKLFSRKLCTIGSVLDNFNPRLRNRPIQALNRVFYIQEKYEKSVLAKRKMDAQKEEREKRKAERKRQRDREKQKILARLNAKRRRTDQNGKAAPTHDEHNENDEPEDDYFGEHPDDDELSGEHEEDEYNPVVRMTREITQIAEEISSDDDDEDLPAEVDIFTNTQAKNYTPTVDLVLGDDPGTTMAYVDETRLGVELGTFASNDPAFFNLEQLTEFFCKATMDMITDDDILMHSIRK